MQCPLIPEDEVKVEVEDKVVDNEVKAKIEVVVMVQSDVTNTDKIKVVDVTMRWFEVCRQCSLIPRTIEVGVKAKVEVGVKIHSEVMNTTRVKVLDLFLR